MSFLYPSLEEMKIHELTLSNYFQHNGIPSFQTHSTTSYTSNVHPPASANIIASAPDYSEISTLKYTNNFYTSTINSSADSFFKYPIASAPSITSSIENLSLISKTQEPTTSNTFKHYPSLDYYMGLELASALYNSYAKENEENKTLVQSQSIPYHCESNGGAPEVTNKIRNLICCKDANGLIGLRVSAINEGIFVCLVQEGSPAALIKLRFGDQILQINGETLTGCNVKQVHKIFKKCSANNIQIAVRDRPFERTIKLHKKPNNTFGFHFKHGKIFSLIKDSSACQNGLLINHQILEVNNQNVVGLKDKDIRDIINQSEYTVILTIMPYFVYEHMMKKTSFHLVRETMDHSQMF